MQAQTFDYASPFGTGADGDVTIGPNGDLSTAALAQGRTCADGVSYSVVSLGASSATLSVSPQAGCLAPGDEVLLIQLQGIPSDTASVGNYEFLRVAEVAGANVSFSNPVSKLYGNQGTNENIGTQADQHKVMLQRVPNYRNLTIPSSRKLTASAWDGVKGGVLAFRVSGTLTLHGALNMDARGYRGGPGSDGLEGYHYPRQGESFGGPSETEDIENNLSGGGAGITTSAHLGGGGGGSYVGAGERGHSSYAHDHTQDGQNGGHAGETRSAGFLLGSGGGSGDYNAIIGNGAGGNGGGAIFFVARTTAGSGAVTAKGGDGVNADNQSPRYYGPDDGGAGGGGAGGSVIAPSSNLAAYSFSVSGGNGGTGSYNNGSTSGGRGGEGALIEASLETPPRSASRPPSTAAMSAATPGSR